MQTTPSLKKTPSIFHPELLCIIVLLCVYGSILVWTAWYSQQISVFVLVKIIPLLLIIRISYRRDVYHLQWASMLILLYFLDGMTNLYAGFKEVQTVSMASIYFSLVVPALITAATTLYFILCIRILRPLKQQSKQKKSALRED